VESGARLVGWLPLSALFQRVVNLAAMMAGAATHFAPPSDVVRAARRVEPDVFVAVPRFLHKLRAGIVGGATASSRLLGWLVLATLAAARAVGRARRVGDAAPLSALVLYALSPIARKLRAILGRRLGSIVVGSAPVPLALQDELEGLGLPILEAYGVSECALPIAMNRLSLRRPGTVGVPLVSLRLAPDGEIEITCAALASPVGGWRLPMTDDGYLRTGDFGALDSDGFLRIVGRKASMFKLASGKQVVPELVEARINGVPWVENAQVMGRGLAAACAVVWVDGRDANAPSDAGAMRAELRRCVAGLPRHMRPRRFVLVDRPASIEGGELTRTLKLRRAANEARFASAFDESSGDVDIQAEEGAWRRSATS
jgi:long-chain acyl-CoA synthetase